MTNYGQELQDAVAYVLRVERATRELTLDDLAERSGVPKVTLHRYLKAQRDIPIKTLVDICAGLGISLGDVIRRAEERLKSQELKKGDAE